MRAIISFHDRILSLIVEQIFEHSMDIWGKHLLIYTPHMATA